MAKGSQPKKFVKAKGKIVTHDEALAMGYALADALGITDQRDQGEKPTK